MAAITGIPTTRVSDLFVRQRILEQVRMDQLALFQYQMQLSTGHRLQSPSEDADAALRIMSLQQLLERKDQVRSNMMTNESFMAMTDTALGHISSSIASARGVGIGALGTINSDTQRQAAAQQISQTIQHLLDLGNQQFRGRYLFSGTQPDVRPFQTSGLDFVEYAGNEGRLSSYSDVDLLFETNVNGNEVFSAISEPVLGTVNIEPVLAFNTRLSDINGGKGVAPGSISITGGGSTVIIDISTAETIGDVALMIRNNAPAGKRLDVEITATGLDITLIGVPGDTMTIHEVGGGTTADELGIRAETAAVTVSGDDLDPIVRLTTPLDDVLGTRSYAVVRSSGVDNDIIFEADTIGNSFDGINIEFIDDGSVVVPGTDEVASYNAGTSTLTVTVKTGSTQARHVVAAVQTAHGLGSVPLTARLDPLDTQSDGKGLVSVGSPVGVTAEGNGTPLDKNSGMRIVNGENTHVVTFADAETVEDMLNLLNMAGAGLLAQINEDATGIDVRSRISGCDLMIGENGGTTATQLGLRSFTGNTRLEDLKYGAGMNTTTGTDFTITMIDGTQVDVDVSGLETINEVLAAIAAVAPATLDARLAVNGNGVELEDSSVGGGALSVSPAFASDAAFVLGLVPEGQQTSSPPTVMPGGEQVLTGSDTNPSETEGIFTALLRLKEALQNNDMPEAERAIEMLDTHTVNLNFGQAELGARMQGLDVMRARLESEEVDLRSAMSLDFDADMVEVISNFTGRQAALEASLRASGSILQMTLLNYL